MCKATNYWLFIVDSDCDQEEEEQHKNPFEKKNQFGSLSNFFMKLMFVHRQIHNIIQTVFLDDFRLKTVGCSRRIGRRKKWQQFKTYTPTNIAKFIKQQEA